MADYKEMYYQLFNEITDVIEKLKEIQCKMEEMYAETDGKSDESQKSLPEWYCKIPQKTPKTTKISTKPKKPRSNP